MRLVEAVAGELLHEVKEVARRFLALKPRSRAPGHEALALLGHLLELLLAHGAAEEVGFAERVTGDEVGDLHHLFLVDDDAVGLRKDGLELIELVDDFAAAVLAFNEVVDHAALNGAGAVEGVERAEVFNALRLIAAKDIAHARRFKLEDAAGEAVGEDVVGLLVVERQVVKDEVRVAVCLISLMQSSMMVSVVRPRKSILRSASFSRPTMSYWVTTSSLFFDSGTRFGEGLGADDDAGGVHGAVARHAFETDGDVEDFLDAGILTLQVLEAGFLFEGGLELDVQLIGDELGDLLDVADLHVEDAADVFDGGLGAESAEGDDLGDVVAAVFLGDVVDGLAAAARAEIDVDVGHADALGVEEALKEQAVLQAGRCR